MGEIPADGVNNHRMITLPIIPDTFQPKFDKMWQSACRVCDNILAYQPDLIISLMHSGWGPVFAAQILWQQTQSTPFPPIVRSNIGREKINIFEDAFNLITTDFFVGEYSSDIEVGKLLAWLTTRTDWHQQLRQQVTEATQKFEEHQRILIVDDCVHEGSTSILVLGLLDWVFPNAQMRFLDADSWYRSDYTSFLLDVLYPRAALFPDGKIPTEDVRIHLGRVAIGSENAPDDSLHWLPISLDSPSAQALSVYRPAADWVQVSHVIYATIANHITQRAASYLPSEPNRGDFGYGLRISWCIMRDIWLEHGISRHEAKRRYKIFDQEIERILDGWIKFDDVALKGYGRGARYVIPDLVQRYVEKLEELPTDPLSAYWLLPGKLMFGERPWYVENMENNDYMHQAMRYILDQGVDCWLDVQIIQEGKSPIENPFFVEEADAMGRTVIAQFIPLPIQYISKENYILTRRRRPNRKDIRPILDLIDKLLTDGRVLYVSTADRDLRGVIGGCYLARHGQTGPTALAALQTRRAASVRGWKREPASRQARRYVRSWPAGL